MPELPDVEVFKEYFDSNGLDKPIKEVEMREEAVLGDLQPRVLRNILKGERFLSSLRHGKYLFIKVGDATWLSVHFGMTGYFDYYQTELEPDGHPRVIFHFKDGSQMVYDCQRKLGELDLLSEPAELIEEKNLGPDALKDVGQDEFKDIFTSSRAMAKSTLMNQETIAGIGNIYSDEILFQTGIHPRIKASRLTSEKITRLYGKMNQVLNRAIEREVDPEKLPEDYLLSHRTPGTPCPKCGSKIERVKVSGRSAYFCPECQKVSA